MIQFRCGWCGKNTLESDDPMTVQYHNTEEMIHYCNVKCLAGNHDLVETD